MLGQVKSGQVKTFKFSLDGQVIARLSEFLNIWSDVQFLKELNNGKWVIRDNLKEIE